MWGEGKLWEEFCLPLDKAHRQLQDGFVFFFSSTSSSSVSCLEFHRDFSLPLSPIDWTRSPVQTPGGLGTGLVPVLCGDGETCEARWGMGYSERMEERWGGVE